MQVLFFTNNIRSLDDFEGTSYTDWVPREMAANLSRLLTRLYIVTDDARQWGASKRYPNVLFISVADYRKMSNTKASDRIVYFFCGYDPVKILFLKARARKHGAKVVSYIFDSHKLAADHLHVLKKLYIHLRFSIGLLLINTLDGVVVYTKAAHQVLRLKVPYLVSRIGVHVPEMQASLNTKRQDIYTMLYAGGLYRHNCLEEVAAAMSYINISQASLLIFGEGPLQGALKEMSRNNPSIHVYPSLSKYELHREYRKADLLINIREPGSKTAPSTISFPSKLLEYFSMGTPVLTTNFTNDIDLPSMSYMVEETTPESIARAMRHAYEDGAPEEKVAHAKAYILARHDWIPIAEELYAFFEILF